MHTFMIIRKLLKVVAFSTLILTFLTLSGCAGNIGVGVSVGVPIGKYGYISVGSGSNWF